MHNVRLRGRRIFQVADSFKPILWNSEPNNLKYPVSCTYAKNVEHRGNRHRLTPSNKMKLHEFNYRSLKNKNIILVCISVFAITLLIKYILMARHSLY